jgi:hypothetical protein
MTDHQGYSVIVDGTVVAQFDDHEYVEALEECYQQDYMNNSPELNDGTSRSVTVELHFNGKPILKEVTP